MVNKDIQEAFIKHNENIGKEYDCVLITKEDAEKLKALQPQEKKPFFDNWNKEQSTQQIQQSFQPMTPPTPQPFNYNQPKDSDNKLWYIIVAAGILILAAILIIAGIQGWNKSEISCPASPSCPACPASPSCPAAPSCPTFNCGNISVSFPSNINLKINMSANGTL